MSDIREALEKAIAALERHDMPEPKRLVFMPESIYKYGPEEFERAARNENLSIVVIPDEMPKGGTFRLITKESET